MQTPIQPKSPNTAQMQYAPDLHELLNTATTAAATEVGSAGLGQTAAHLTAEGLLLYCQTQLNSLDGEINGMLEEQVRNLKRKEALTNVENTMKKYAPPSAEAAWDDISAAYDAAINSLPEGDPAREALIAKKDELWATYGPGGIGRAPTKAEWEGHTSDVRQEVDNIKGNSEIMMIRLQSTVSARQTAVQLTTNILSKFHQTIQSVVNNVKG